MKKNNVKIVLLVVFSILLVTELIFLGFSHWMESTLPEPTDAPTQAPTEEPTEAPTTEPTEAPTEEPTAEPTEPPTEEPTEAPTEEVDDGRYVLTFAGDCTFGATASKWNYGSSFIQVVGENYDWPFANLVKYFEADDFTMINLEGPLTETGSAAQKTFAFRGPTAYTQIMTGSSVEAVTLANNHAMDYGQEGYDNTIAALEGAGIGYVEENKTSIFTTESGLTIGLYADSFNFSNSDIRKNVKALKDAGADIIVCAFHWGTEGSYRPSAAVQGYAHAAIDAGADIVYGHHPHVLQKIEEYGDGIIYYSLGNCSFGGSTAPKDFDSAIVQQEIIRNEDGSCSLGELTIIPISVSSVKGTNNYQPTPMEAGTDAYNRVISKLDGSFTGPDLVVDYSHLEPTETPTEAPTEAPTAPPATNPPATEAPSSGNSSGEGAGESASGSEDSGSGSDSGEAVG